MSDTNDCKTVRLNIKSTGRDFPAIGGYAEGTALEGEALICINVDFIAQTYCNEEKDAAFGFRETLIETLAHEIFHVAEEIYGLAFSEERVEVALEKARNHLRENPNDEPEFLESIQVISQQQDSIVSLSAEIEHLRDSLEKIVKYGKKNSGHGYSCSKMAEEALKKE